MRTSSKSMSHPGQLSPTPQPGEIWQVSRLQQSPLELSGAEQTLYSVAAKQFLAGNSPSRFVIIITPPELLVETDQEWEVVSVMLLSTETHSISDVDLLIPAHISGLGQDLLAETWHVLPMIGCNLLQPVGERLSRQIYDHLLNVGDYYHGLIDEQPIVELDQSVLKVGFATAQQPEIQAFHQREIAWRDVLTVPLAAYRTYLKSIKFTNAVLASALQIEREFAQSPRKQVFLNHWWQNIFEVEWIAAPRLAIATRSPNQDDIHSDRIEITTLIQQLSVTQDEHQRRRYAKQLGEIAVGNSQAIQALVNLLQTTQDDETLWTAVESLWQIDPGNPAAGVRRVKLVDLGMQVAGMSVALAVAQVKKSDSVFGVLLQVYPTENQPYLPPDLQLVLLDGSGQTLREVKARQADVYIQLKFSGQSREQFSVRIALGSANITEDFVI
jgi:Protein of unknown function (DUF1822)